MRSSLLLQPVGAGDLSLLLQVVYIDQASHEGEQRKAGYSCFLQGWRKGPGRGAALSNTCGGRISPGRARVG